MKKNNYSVLIVIFFVAFVLKSCAVPALPKKQFIYSSDNPNALLVGSVTFPKEDAAADSYFFRVTSIDSDKKIAGKNSTEIHIKPKFIYRLIHNGQLDNGKTYLFAIERPEGKYEIPSIRIFRNQAAIAAVKDFYIGGFSIPFELKKGEIKYIGNIVFNEYAGKNDTMISLENNFEKDIAKLKEKRPLIEWKNTINDFNIKLERTSKKAKL